MKMRKFKRKRLNNKGFTLIELLAVVVILAVVMGIAMTSVLSSMNKARGGSLSDTATTIAQAFNQKYTESLVDGIPNAVYSDVSGFSTGYDFTTDKTYYIASALKDEFNISNSAYDLTGTGDFPTTGTVNASFVDFDADTGKFTVCMFAKTTGNVYVSNYNTTKTSLTTLPISGVTAATDTMFACSDGTKSW